MAPKKIKKTRQVSQQTELLLAKMEKAGYLTVAQASQLTSVPRQTIYTWIHTKALSVQRVGPRRVFVSVEDLRKLVPAI